MPHDLPPRDRDVHGAIARLLISWMEQDHPGTRWIELPEGAPIPADAVAVRTFGPDSSTPGAEAGRTSPEETPETAQERS